MAEYTTRHSAIVEAIRARDARAAADAMDRHPNRIGRDLLAAR